MKHITVRGGVKNNSNSNRQQEKLRCCAQFFFYKQSLSGPETKSFFSLPFSENKFIFSHLFVT